MRPTKQGFKTTQSSRLQRHDGLIDDHKLFSFESTSQISFQLEQFKCLRMHAGIEYFVSGLAHAFRPVHSCIGIAEDVFRTLILLRAKGDPHTNGGEYLAAA